LRELKWCWSRLGESWGQLSVVGVEFALVRAVVWVVLGKDDVWGFILL